VPVSQQVLLAVRDPDTGITLPHGASGELWIGAPSRFVEYLDNPSATARAIDADGVFRTGDLAHLADPGFIFEARIGDAMRLGGFLVSPEEIEAVIQAQPGVAGVQVVSASHRGAIRCRWHSFGPAPAQCCKKPRCVHLVCSNWHASKFRSGS
jgi:fatty-acyl-CoA synthase